MSRATGRRLSTVVGMTPVPAATRMGAAVVATEMVEEEVEVKEVAKWEAAVAVTVVAAMTIVVVRAMTMVVAMTVAVTMGVVMEAVKEVTVVAREVTVVAKAATAVIVIHSVFSAAKVKAK